jgi:hypothetical protein
MLSLHWLKKDSKLFVKSIQNSNEDTRLKTLPLFYCLTIYMYASPYHLYES